MTEVNEDVNGAIENNEQEMIDEGAPVDPPTDPVIHGDSDPAGTNKQDDNAEATEGTEATEATEGAEAPEAEGAEAAEGVEAQDAEATSDFDAEYRKRLREYTRELKKQPGEWYIIQSYSGYENKVKTNLEMRSQTLEVEDSIYEVVVPVEQALEKNKDGKNKLVKRKLLPGYVLVRMNLNEDTWSVVRHTPGVTGFVGNAHNPAPRRCSSACRTPR